MERAYSLTFSTRNESYNLVSNNCEHFATWARNGWGFSQQVFWFINVYFFHTKSITIHHLGLQYYVRFEGSGGGGGNRSLAKDPLTCVGNCLLGISVPAASQTEATTGSNWVKQNDKKVCDKCVLVQPPSSIYGPCNVWGSRMKKEVFVGYMFNFFHFNLKIHFQTYVTCML